MDFMAILALVEKGVTVISALISAGESAAPAIQVLTGLITGAKTQTVTQEQMDAADAALDALVADFNLDLPAAQPGDPDYVPPAS